MFEITRFEERLPYAFVLGAADAWADAFADLYTTPPTWYHSQRSGPFRPRLFVNDVGRSLRTAGETLPSRPRGSGFSGGGGSIW